jgi:NAD(P)H-hydrate epimerase
MVKEHITKIPERKEDAHKGDFGKVLVVAGSRGMTGAACLCCEGALVSGSGLVYSAIPRSLNDIMEIKLTEVITKPMPETSAGSLSLKAGRDILDLSRECDAVALGPGLGKDPETAGLVKELVQKIEAPLVLDADGLNALQGDMAPLKKREGVTVLTPHPGEMSRLTGSDVQAVQSDRKASARELASGTGAVVCLKGHGTAVADPEGYTYVNETGNSGMATGGSGDILTGMITSFTGQGIDVVSSVICAVHLHGLAGDIAAEEMGQFCMTPSDMLDVLPDAFHRAGL